VAIHPSQIEVIKNVFFPSEEELLEAKLIIKAFNESEEGVISFDGKMIDKPLVDAKEKILLMAGLNPKDFR
jgi:citrate lyase beta subunit